MALEGPFDLPHRCLGLLDYGVISMNLASRGLSGGVLRASGALPDACVALLEHFGSLFGYVRADLESSGGLRRRSGGSRTAPGRLCRGQPAPGTPTYRWGRGPRAPGPGPPLYEHDKSGRSTPFA